MIFQEIHISGHMWWKKTYYTYWQFFESRMVQIETLDLVTIESLKK